MVVPGVVFGFFVWVGFVGVIKGPCVDHWLFPWGGVRSWIRSFTVITAHWSAGLVVPRRLAITSPTWALSLVASWWASLVHWGRLSLPP